VDIVAVKLSDRSYEFAKTLTGEKRVTLDEMDDWSEHRPSAQQENEFIEKHGYREYGRWFLGIDDEYPEDRKSRYKFPYGDFDTVHRCGVIAAEVRAAQRKYTDIEVAAAHLHGMLDELM
jgi:predicted Rossmann fold nucleotide-binding protein DprA/Smf involved in DNA uptake